MPGMRHDDHGGIGIPPPDATLKRIALPWITSPRELPFRTGDPR